MSDDEPGRGEPRRYPSTIGGALFLLVLATAVAGIVVVEVGPWRVGLEILAAALIFAGVCRAFLPERDAGMLAVRNRAFDASLLLIVGVVLFFLAATLPNQS